MMKKGPAFCLETPNDCYESSVAFSTRALYIVTLQGEDWIIPFSQIISSTPEQIIFYQNNQKWRLKRRKR